MMKSRLKGQWARLSFAFAGLSLCLGDAHAAEPKHLDVDAMLRIGSVGDSSVLGWRDDQRELAHISPNGTKVAIVVQSGDPADNAIRGQLLLFNVADLLDSHKAPKPQIMAEYASRTNYQPIAGLKWTDDSSLIFAAVDGDAPMQVYRLNIVSKTITQLTNETQPIAAFAMSQDAKGLLVVTDAPPPVAPKDKPECLNRGCRVTATRATDAITGADNRGLFPGNLAYYAPAGGRRELASLYELDGIKDCSPNDFIPGGLSPNGRYALFFCTRSSWPDWWADYTVSAQFTEMIRKGNTNYAKQYVLLDVKANEVRPLNSAPYLRFAPPYDPIWIDGGNRLLLAGAVEPLEGTRGAERQKRAGRLGLISVDPATGKTDFAFALDNKMYRYVAKATWSQEDCTLAIEAVTPDDKTAPPMAWRRGADGWERIGAFQGEASRAPLTFRLAQSPNARPVLYAAKAGDGVGRKVLDPNPWLDEYKLGFVDEIRWKSVGGHDWEGSIYYPPNYVKGRRYPLVILTHGVDRGRFSPNGYARNYAAQPLAARGMIVLQMNERGLYDVTVNPKELPRSREGIEGAIDEMDRRGLVDRDRIGLVGWSRTSWYVNYMASHSEYPLKAVMITDGADIGWWTYIHEGVLDEIEADLGAAPFGRGLEKMLETASTFNLDRWRAPVLMWSAGEDVGLWDLFAGLRRLEIPAEYWLFPDGTHDIFKMSHRRAGNELMVDWFDFWLNEHEVPDAAKTDQYQRWRDLRKKWKSVSSIPRPPLLDWSATVRANPAR